MPMVAEKKNIKTSNNVTLFVIVGWSDTALTPYVMKEYVVTVGQACKKEKGKWQLCSLALVNPLLFAGSSDVCMCKVNVCRLLRVVL